MPHSPTLSVVLATRDRPGPFAEALASVLTQDHDGFEVVVVDDGSTEENRRLYEPALAEAAARLGPGRLQVHRLARRPRGHGQSYALNTGVAHAAGGHVCFLDDDDWWTDPGHLARAAAAVRGGAVDLYMANQHAFRDGVRLPGPTWIEALADGLAARGVVPRADGCFAVAVEDLMGLKGFCHVNALTVRRAHWDAVGGMDEGIRWECDRDLFLRLVDRAAPGAMLHHPAVVARHNVPDPAKAASMTTSAPMMDKWLYQLRVLDKAALLARHPAIRAHGRRHKAWTLKHIAEALRAAGDWDAAAWYAREALGAGPTAGWSAFTLYCGAAALLRGRGRGASAAAPR